MNANLLSFFLLLLDVLIRNINIINILLMKIIHVLLPVLQVLLPILQVLLRLYIFQIDF